MEEECSSAHCGGLGVCSCTYSEELSQQCTYLLKLNPYHYGTIFKARQRDTGDNFRYTCKDDLIIQGMEWNRRQWLSFLSDPYRYVHKSKAWKLKVFTEYQTSQKNWKCTGEHDINSAEENVKIFDYHILLLKDFELFIREELHIFFDAMPMPWFYDDLDDDDEVISDEFATSFLVEHPWLRYEPQEALKLHKVKFSRYMMDAIVVLDAIEKAEKGGKETDKDDDAGNEN